MMTLKLNLPDELAQRAQSAGLLTDTSIQKLLEEAIRREAGRKLLNVAQQLHDANIPPMSDEEVVSEVKAARAALRARNTAN
jgi:hypothetical protein